MLQLLLARKMLRLLVPGTHCLIVRGFAFMSRVFFLTLRYLIIP